MPFAHYHPECAHAEPWLCVEQNAEHLGVTHDSIYRRGDRKGLPAHSVGRLWKFKVLDVDEWVRARGADEDTRQAMRQDSKGERH